MAKPEPAASPGRRFRPQIETALAEGVAADSMSLRLTYRDMSLLARDPNTPVMDISYTGGVMRFLGVRVEKGGVDVSTLEVAGQVTASRGPRIVGKISMPSR